MKFKVGDRLTWNFDNHHFTGRLREFVKVGSKYPEGSYKLYVTTDGDDHLYSFIAMNTFFWYPECLTSMGMKTTADPNDILKEIL